MVATGQGLLRILGEALLDASATGGVGQRAELTDILEQHGGHAAAEVFAPHFQLGTLLGSRQCPNYVVADDIVLARLGHVVEKDGRLRVLLQATVGVSLGFGALRQR